MISLVYLKISNKTEAGSQDDDSAVIIQRITTNPDVNQNEKEINTEEEKEIYLAATITFSTFMILLTVAIAFIWLCFIAEDKGNVDNESDIESFEEESHLFKFVSKSRSYIKSKKCKNNQQYEEI